MLKGYYLPVLNPSEKNTGRAYGPCLIAHALHCSLQSSCRPPFLRCRILPSGCDRRPEWALRWRQRREDFVYHILSTRRRRRHPVGVEALHRCRRVKYGQCYIEDKVPPLRIIIGGGYGGQSGLVLGNPVVGHGSCVGNLAHVLDGSDCSLHVVLVGQIVRVQRRVGVVDVGRLDVDATAAQRMHDGGNEGEEALPVKRRAREGVSLDTQCTRPRKSPRVEGRPGWRGNSVFSGRRPRPTCRRHSEQTIPRLAEALTPTAWSQFMNV